MKTDDEIRRMQLVESTMVRQQIADLSSALRQKHEAEIADYLQAVRAWERGPAFYPRAPGFLAAAGKLPVVASSEVRGRDVPTRERDVKLTQFGGASQAFAGGSTDAQNTPAILP